MSRPWHKRWHGNALNGMRGLSLELRGAYTTLLDLMYDHGGPIRLEERRLCGEFDCDVRVFKRVMSSLISTGKIRLWSDDSTVWIVNDRMLAEAGVDGYLAQTSAELTPNLREKFGIATPQLSPKSSGKPKENKAGAEDKSEKPDPQKKKKRKEEESRPANAGPAPGKDGQEGSSDLFGGSPPPPPKVDAVKVAYAEWNALASRLGLPVAKDLDDDRRAKIKARMGHGGLERWREALAAVEASSLCRGLKPGSAWKADLDFLLSPSKFRRLLEGAYGREQVITGSGGSVAPPKARPPFANADLRAQIVAIDRLGESWAQAWLDLCRWRPGPRPQIIAPSQTVADRLKREAWAIITGAGAEIIVTKGSS